MTILASGVGAQGPAGTDGQSVVAAGSWSTSTAYTTLDIVEHNGSGYLCRSDHTSAAATEPGVGASWTTVWDLLVSKGDVGGTGLKGDTGDTGPAGFGVGVSMEEDVDTSTQLVSSTSPTDGNVSVTVTKPAGATTGKVVVIAFASAYGAANNTLLRMGVGDGTLDYNEGRTGQSSVLWGSNGTVIGKTITATTTYTLRLWKNSGSQNANVAYQRLVALVIWS